MEYRIDATNKILGRCATEIAMLLRGKDSAAYNPARFSGNMVFVYNIDRIRVTGKKALQKSYYRHSGYPGGLREDRYKDLFRRDSRKVLQLAVSGMLPKNRLRPKMIKNLLLFRGEILK